MTVWVLSKTEPINWRDQFQTNVLAIIASYEDLCKIVSNTFDESGLDDSQCSAHIIESNFDLDFGKVVWKFDEVIITAEECEVMGSVFQL